VLLRLAGSLLAVAVLGCSLATAGEKEARAAALAFGHALTSGDASGLRPVLPLRGKVQLRLQRLGPERGYFSAAQVQAVFGDFLAHGAVRSFEIARVECEEPIALVHGQAVLVDPRGRAARVELHLSLRSENQQWVLREIRELEP
jgi:hypothetical protein